MHDDYKSALHYAMLRLRSMYFTDTSKLSFESKRAMFERDIVRLTEFARGKELPRID